MKTVYRIMAIALLALTVSSPVAAEKKQTQTFTGTYDWKDGGSDELSAEFTSTGEDAWKVKFRFRWSGKSKTWKGTADGSLAEGGKLTGTATTGSRNWVFRATIRDGVMRGEHTEIQSGDNRYATGSFELSR